MAVNDQPLLETPKVSSWKRLCLLASLLAIISTSALVGTQYIKTTFSFVSPRPPHTNDESQYDSISCSAMVLEIARATTMPMDRTSPLQCFLTKTTPHIEEALDMANDVKHRINNPRERAALHDCVELMDSSIDSVLDSIKALQKHTPHSYEDAHVWLSAVFTNHVICMDGLEGQGWTMMEPKLNDLIARARTSLAMVVAISARQDNVLLEPLIEEFPTWVTNRDSSLLKAFPNDVFKPNIVVAQDGSGNTRTVKEAIESVPKNSKVRYIIYVKKGVYYENVRIGKTKRNVMLVGDGMFSTIINGSLNAVDGATTFNSATVAVDGDGFIAQDIGFQNTAGPQKHQAVALRVSGDKSVINRCYMDGYQDTLYAHSSRQFYKDSYITGTIDFIFGYAAVVFQSCKLVARKPMKGQNNMVTAQGRADKNQSSGTSIQRCEVTASSDLVPVKTSVRSYLGRPWKAYSRTVVMQSYIGDHIDPAGWSIWNDTTLSYLDTLYYGEYLNRGPGAGLSKRVKWHGYHKIDNPAEAQHFTVAELIQGGTWLKDTGVSYVEGL
ncbi:hypothetical protein FNV43_RR07776 [Rhamnella rubrinervis]|uniref:Pectinesterase n=1 Tax=Rhamnella rubrinervis TaxID=2594499 RepID=A0A8K0HH68_9ROSA|nr:hypothetical protein FNV43_RR07776 [Rhamnella rubrinervis]